MVDLFGPAPVTIQDMMGCAQRELHMRRRVYPRLVAQGKMRPDEAELETRIMEAIVGHFESLHRQGSQR